MITHKTIFIAPLDWGLGHASRCVPIIQSLSENNRVIIGTTPLNKFFFDSYFPALQKTDLPSYNIRYSTWFPAWLKILFQSQKIKAVIEQEEKLLTQIVKQNGIDIVISDNRFGLHHPETENVFITHQLTIKSPLFSKLANRINQRYIHRFTKVWVPDYETKNVRLSGQLSDSAAIKIPVKYIGPQSALSNLPPVALKSEKTNYLILLSGEEPQRSILEKNLLENFKDSGQKITLVRGSNRPFNSTNKNINVINFAFGSELKDLILNAETIICRSGYSTLMDLHALGKKQIILIPTPGQPEQEYLAAYWAEKFSCRLVEQKNSQRLNLASSNTA